MSSLFSRIIGGEIPSWKVYEDEKTYAFLDINPIQRGQTLIVPKKEVDEFYEIDDETYTALFLTAKKLAPVLKEIIPCKRVGMLIEGLEVPHAHIKLVPISKMGDLDSHNIKKAEQEDLKKLHDKWTLALQ